jgi:hypothetical protein
MRRFVAVCALAGLTFLAPSAALASDFPIAESLCLDQGGSFQSPGPTHYTCSGVGSSLPKRAVATAERACEKTYDGRFDYGGGTYTCSIP